MTTWPDTRVMDLLGLDVPVIQAPMSGVGYADMAVAVCRAGGLGSLGAASLAPDTLRAEAAAVRAGTNRAWNVNFFCHQPPRAMAAQDALWRARLEPYAAELGLDTAAVDMTLRQPFGEEMCAVVEELRPPVVSFHFGLPDERLLARVRATGAKILSSATTVQEARWLEARGCDAIIAQGAEAGGHRGTFLEDGPPGSSTVSGRAQWGGDPARQIGTMALVPLIADAVRVPVIAAGGIADGRGVAAAFMLGAGAVQVGTAYLHCAQARILPLHRAALARAHALPSTLTSIFTGRPARILANRLVDELGPLHPDAPDFPLPMPRIAALRAAAEAKGRDDFSAHYAGQAVAIAHGDDAHALTKRLAEEGAALLAR